MSLHLPYFRGSLVDYRMYVHVRSSTLKYTGKELKVLRDCQTVSQMLSFEIVYEKNVLFSFAK